MHTADLSQNLFNVIAHVENKRFEMDYCKAQNTARLGSGEALFTQQTAPIHVPCTFCRARTLHRCSALHKAYWHSNGMAAGGKSHAYAAALSQRSCDAKAPVTPIKPQSANAYAQRKGKCMNA